MKKVLISQLLKVVVAVVIFTCSATIVKAKEKQKVPARPNVILINIDDLGYGDPSCYGGKLFKTPNIDRLAQEGIQFTNGYVTAPVCGPSRIGLLTGAYQQRFGIQWNHDTYKLPGSEEKGENIIPKRHKKIHEAFKEAGYVTAMAGKYGIPGYPNTGFDYNYSLTSAGAHYFPDENGTYAGVDGAPKPKSGWIRTMWGPEREGDEYLTDRCGRQCIEFIDAHKDQPFFFYLAFNAVHAPYHAKKSDMPRVAHIKSEMMKLYAAMALAIDDNIGRILDYLEKEKLRENTIVVLLSDNGPANPIHLSIPDWWPQNTPFHLMGQRGPLSGFKGNMWEAGIRIPYIISCPGRFEEGVQYDKPVSTLDIYPTLCAAAEVKIPENTHLDGVNLIPYLRGGYADEPHKALFWYANRMGAVRMGKWKYLVEDGKHHLFDLENDISETKNSMKESPEEMIKTHQAFIQFRNEMPACRNPFIRPIDIPDEAVKSIPVVEYKQIEK